MSDDEYTQEQLDWIFAELAPARPNTPVDDSTPDDLENNEPLVRHCVVQHVCNRTAYPLDMKARFETVDHRLCEGAWVPAELMTPLHIEIGPADEEAVIEGLDLVDFERGIEDEAELEEDQLDLVTISSVDTHSTTISDDEEEIVADQRQ